MDPKEVGRRVRGARAYAGFRRVEDLAGEIGIGRSTLLAIEQGRRKAKPWELWAIAEVCGLPRSCFTDSNGGTERTLERIEAKLDKALNDEKPPVQGAP